MREFTHSRIKTVKLTCDRCKHQVEGLRGTGFTAGIYDMTTWDEYRRGDERYVCVSCMFADPKFVERYGSCF
jgi:transposase-like protein